MEHWKGIKNYEGLYEVSSYGAVRALERAVLNKNGKSQKYPAKLLKADVLTRNHTSYARVTLCKDHKTSRFQVHRLVAETFLTPCSNKPHVNHLDNNGLNNKVENLEWCTHSENMLHAQKQGRLFDAQSKGGSMGRQKEVEKAMQEVQAMIGKQYTYWVVNDYHITKKPDGKNNYRVLCTCTLCNNSYDRSAKDIRNLASKSCKTCALTIRRRYSLVSHESVSCM